MRVLVTGGAGFIGSAVCRHLISDLKWDVVVVDKLTYAGNLQSLASLTASGHYSFEQHDICDRTCMEQIFTSFQPQGVLHLAAESHVDRSISGSEAFVRTNVLGTFTLLEVARIYLSTLPSRVASEFRFIHVSTDEVYGSLDNGGFFTEDTRYDPSSPYSATKAGSDHLARAWHRTYGLPVIITNCSNNYGPYHFPEKLIPLAIINAIEGKKIPVYGEGKNIRDWLYVDDHARALALVLQKGIPGQTYNVGGRNERANIEVVRTICTLLDHIRPQTSSHHELISFVADRPGHDHRYAIDASKLERALGWHATETFETGIEKTVRWYLERRDWWEPLRSGVYGGERLGLVHA